MKEETTMMQPLKRAAAVKLVTMDEPFERMRDIYDRIACRAFEIFETNGRQFGRDLENWCKAESELLHPVHMDITETEGELKVCAEVPGFREKDLEVSVEPKRLTITGKRESKEERKTGKTIYSEHCSNQIFRAIDLPVEVDAEKVTATIKDGVLELELPKAVSAKKIQVAAQAA
jgi:HSP20 family protein